MCPASCRIGGTSGSVTKLLPPFRIPIEEDQTLFSSVGSRKTVEPFEPCWCRFSAPLVEKISRNRSTSSTLVVARIISLSSAVLAFALSSHHLVDRELPDVRPPLRLDPRR